jgi:hypothetical protein
MKTIVVHTETVANAIVNTMANTTPHAPFANTFLLVMLRMATTKRLDTQECDLQLAIVPQAQHCTQYLYIPPVDHTNQYCWMLTMTMPDRITD